MTVSAGNQFEESGNQFAAKRQSELQINKLIKYILLLEIFKISKAVLIVSLELLIDSYKYMFYQ